MYVCACVWECGCLEGTLKIPGEEGSSDLLDGHFSSHHNTNNLLRLTVTRCVETYQSEALLATILRAGLSISEWLLTALQIDEKLKAL